VFQALTAGDMQAWALGKDAVQLSNVCMVAITRIVSDDLTGEKFLSVYSLYGFEAVPGETMRKAFEVIRGFARETGCRSITATTNTPRVVELAEQTGGDTSWRFLNWRV
jgi:hypothetical protein